MALNIGKDTFSLLGQPRWDCPLILVCLFIQIANTCVLFLFAFVIMLLGISFWHDLTDISARSFYEPILVTEFLVKYFNHRELTRPLTDQDRIKVCGQCVYDVCFMFSFAFL